MKGFKGFHPIVNFIYFLFVISFSMVFIHPVTLSVSLIAGFAYLMILRGKARTVKSLLYMLPIVLLMAALNPLFNHRGTTILAYLPNGNPLTAEAVCYGILSGLMLVSVICFFGCFNEVITEDKIIYLFGRAIPNLSVVFSLILRLVPRLTLQFKSVSAAQKCIGRDMERGGIRDKAESGMSVLSVIVARSLENGIETADSMKARGYGKKRRTSYSTFLLDNRDIYALIVILISAGFVIWGAIYGKLRFVCFPEIKMSESTMDVLLVYLVYFVLCSIPVIIELWEVIKWRHIKSKI